MTESRHRRVEFFYIHPVAALAQLTLTSSTAHFPNGSRFGKVRSGTGTNGLGVISHFVNRRAGFICVIIAGCPQLNDYRSAAEHIRRNSFHDPKAAWLCDLSQADFPSARNLQFLKLATFLDDVNPHSGRVAVIGPKPLRKPLIRFAADHNLPDWMVFHEECDAYRWMTTGRLPDQSVPSINLGSNSINSST